MSARSLSALRSTRRATVGALAFSLCLPLAAQEPTPAPSRIETLAVQTRILARLLERELLPSTQADAWRSLYPSIRYALPPQDTAGDSAARETKELPQASDTGRVVGEEPPNSDPYRVLTYGDTNSALFGALAHRESSRKLQTIRSAAIPGCGALLWVEVDLPVSRMRVSSSIEDASDPARAAWDQVRQELEGNPPRTNDDAQPETAVHTVVDPNAEAAIVSSVEKTVLAHATRLEALETGESITIVLTLRSPTELDQLLTNSRQHTIEALFLENVRRDASSPAARAQAPRATEVVRVLRCPRIAPGTSAPKQLETVTRYTQR